ncbi:porin [Halomonas icarae]|uniref:Porin n=2 Tax=Halomonas icarae TaxID=2691040 RepID=A0A7X5AKY9_9GAMM|nr:porin [Halomonas icarae]MDR5903163.1 porin [Halomonas icarae]NAW12857.1 porin [Halomonas icarae]
MKKTLLATAIAGAMIATGAQAATVYDQDGTKLDVYGRIAMGVAGGGVDRNEDTGAEINNDADFVDVYSRLGLRMSHEVTSDLTAFGRVEWRFRADESGNKFGNDFDAFSETRQAYIGLRSDSWGTVQAGNFDSIYNQYVSLPFDVYIDRGLEFAGHTIQSRGDSVAYMTPNLAGFSVALQGKHYSNRGAELGEDGATQADVDKSTEVAFQGALKYEIDNLRLALGAVDDVVEGGGNDEMLYGATASYEFMPGFSGRLGYETQDDSGNGAKDGFDTWGVGMSYAVNQWAFALDYYKVDEDKRDSKRDAWAAGAYYNVSDSFQTFLELNDADADLKDSKIKELNDDVYYLVGARYFF